MKLLVLIVSLLASVAGLATAADEEAVRFRDQVAPILVTKCLACHGPKKAVAGFRVDTVARLMGESDAGKSIEPGKPDESLFLELIESNEPTGRMPKNADPLPTAEVALLRRWIAEGAKLGGVEGSTELASLIPRPSNPPAPATYRTAVPVMALTYSPDGRQLASGGYREVLVWDSMTGKLIRRLPGAPQRTQGLAYNGDGLMLALAGGVPGESGDLTLFDPTGVKPARPLASSSDLFLGVAFSPDGSLVGCSGADRSLRVHDVASGKELCQVKQYADWVTGVAFDRDGVSVAGSSSDKLVKVFEARTGKLQATYIGHNAPVFAVSFDPETNKALTAGADRKLHAWDPKVIAAEDGTAAQQEDRFKKEISARMISGFNEDILEVAVSRGRAFCGSADGKIQVVDLKTSQVVHQIEAQPDWIYALTVSPDGTRIASGGGDGAIRIWDIETGKLLLQFVAAP